MTIAVHPVFARAPDAFLRALGVACTVTIGEAEPLAAMVIARSPSGDIVPAGSFGEDGIVGPRLTASFASSAVPGLVDGDTLTIGATSWTIRNPLPDGRGMTRCDLEAE